MTRLYKGFLFKTKPWKHQLKALSYLYNRDKAALYTKPGTGKTKVMLDLIVNKGWRRGIIVATVKACEVWEQQFQLHTDIDPKWVYNLQKMTLKQKVALMNKLCPKGKRGPLDEPMYLIINYDSVWRKAFENILYRKSCSLEFAICDESHHIKTPGSKCSMALKRIGKAVNNKYLVTGTPMSENPLDVYAQYRFLDDTIFGTSYSRFKERYENVDPILTAKVGYVCLNKAQPYINLDELRTKMYSCAFTIKSSVKLPKRKNLVVKFPISGEALKVYRELEKDGISMKGVNALRIKAALSKYLRLQQVCSGFMPTEDPYGNAKVFVLNHDRRDTLVKWLNRMDKHEPVVIFAAFRHDFDEIQEACRIAGRSYSEVSGAKDNLHLWKKGKRNVVAVQYKSGSESIDLTRARYLIYYNLTISLALYEQSKKRIHRPGQTRECTYIHIVGDLPNRKDSVDRRILKSLKRKQDIVQYIEQEGRD